MPCAVTAFGVRIASPSETAVESFISREVMGDWNAHHGLAEKRVLVPVTDCKSASDASDLLIAFLDAGDACPESSPDGLYREIDSYLGVGKPVLIYCSEARNELLGTHALQGQTLEKIRQRFAAASVDFYSDEKEYRAKFAFQLEALLGGHDYFQKTVSVSAPTAGTLPAPAKPAPVESLSSCARTILSEACDDFEAYIGHIKTGQMLKIQANGKQLVEQGDPAAAARWESAFQELLRGDFIRDAGFNGQLFQISEKGFAFLKTIGKTPVGYIAEMGGM